MSRTLLFTPTYIMDGKPKLWPQTQESIDGIIAPPDVEITKLIGLDNPYPIGPRNVLHQYQKARELVLSEGYDALFTVEHDMIIPEDALIKLWATDALIVYGLYRFRTAPYPVNAIKCEPKESWPGSSLTFRPNKYTDAEKQGWVEVSGMGMGCTLIRRKLLEQFEFRAERDNYPPDYGLSHDCYDAGIKQIMRFDVKCGHILEDDRILWPGESVNRMIKCKILTNFNGDVNGESVRFHAGEIVDLPDVNAYRFASIGFLEIIEKLAVKIVTKPKMDKAIK